MRPRTSLEEYARQLDESFTAASHLGPRQKVVVIAELWKTVPEEFVEGLVQTYPELIGSQDGVPFAVRSAANRNTMTEDRAALRAKSVADTIDAAGRARLRALDSLLASTGPTTDPETGEVKPGKYRDFVLYVPASLGKLAEVDGDLRAADNVVVLVPGMFNNLNIFDTLSTPAGRVRDEAGANRTAAVTWLGYEPPDGPTGLLKSKARAASRDLKSFMYALELEEAPGARRTVLAHSYGTVVARFAFEGGDPRVDAVSMAGSPGLGKSVATAADLGFLDQAGNPAPLIVTRAAMDPVALLRPHHHDPAGFPDVIRASSTGGADPGVGHRKYYGVNTQSLKNMANVVTGDLDAIPRALPDEWPSQLLRGVGAAISPAANLVQVVADSVEQATGNRSEPSRPVQRKLMKPTPRPGEEPRLGRPDPLSTG